MQIQNYEEYKKEIARQTGNPPAPKIGFSAFGLAFAILFVLIGFYKNTTISAVSAGLLILVTFAFPFYIMKLLMLRKMTKHLKESEKSGLPAYYRPSRSWVGLYLVMFVGLLYLFKVSDDLINYFVK